MNEYIELMERTLSAWAKEYPIEWVEQAYKNAVGEPTTKNDLEVDWETYKDVDGNSLDDLILEVLQNNFDCGNTYGYKVADEIIALLPSVTPQERKGHWIKGYTYSDGEYWKCDKCNELIKVKYPMHYCNNCGSDNREVEE